MSNPNVAAVLESPKARLTIVNRSIPNPEADQLLIRNHAVAANPLDWKIQEYGFGVKNYPIILGSDVSGVVVAVGSAVTKFKVGDRVTGFAEVFVTADINQGAWQTYTILRQIVTAKIPDSLSFAEASVFPAAFATSAYSLFSILGVPRPSGKQVAENTGIVIWGASSSLGTVAVQLAKIVGLKIYATAGPTNFEYVKSLGATEVFDYRDPQVVSKIIEAAKTSGVSINLGYDTVSDGKTSQAAGEVLSAFGKGRLVIVLPLPSGEPKPDNIEVTQVAVAKLFTEEHELTEWLFNNWLPKALGYGVLVPSPKVQIIEGGIEAAQKVLDLLKKGVSATKLVVTL